MLLFIPSLLVSLLLAAPATLTPPTSQEVQVRGQRAPREDQDSIKVVISEGCATQGDASDASHGGKEINLIPGSPLVLTHKINLVPSGSGSGSGSCGCETDFAALKDRLERIEREVSALREKCGGADGGCCTSKESKGAGCSITPEVHDCPNECSDQGRCLEGKCVCFTGFSGPDCSRSDCPGNCNDNGKCVTGRCVCDPGFTGPDCSQRDCPSKCNNRGKCVKGRCLCDGGFAGPTCSDKTCPGNCNSRGRCVDGECVCSPGFAAPDCSMKACPDGCNNRGKCVNGKCVCDSGFTGEDCSEVACPGNCNSRGRCLNGACVCEDGFSGPDCSRRTCPNDCNNRGKCLNGKCVCDSSFTGEDCSETSCPENCNSRGRCVDGRCVCRNGFTGADCSEKACPKNCSNRGRCMNGRCACDVGASGPDCSYKACPKNCNMKGRCIKGRCVCRRGFTGPDCSQCEKGMTGPNCDTVMSGVSQLSVRDVTETGATVVWTPPPVQYDTYHITFTSQKEGDQQITAQLDGGLTGFTQTGLASGQEYRVSIAGEVDGQKGAESSTEFMTLLSGPTNLQVAKMTTTSAVVQWVESQGEIDRYRLTVTPNDGTGRSQEMTVPAGQSSAHIQQLEPGRLYDITLVAEKGSSRSEPTTTQVTPGKTLPVVTTEAFTMQVTLAPEQVVVKDSDPVPEVPTQLERTEDGSDANSVKVGGTDGPSKDSAAAVTARTKHLVSSALVRNGTRPKLFSKKPNVLGPFRFNTTRVTPGARNTGPSPLKKSTMIEKKKKKMVPTMSKPNPRVITIGNRTITLTVRNVEALGSERRDTAVTSGTDSDANRQHSLEEPTVAVGSTERPDVGMASHGDDTTAVSVQPVSSVKSQEKKCMNKIKVTHIRLPHKDRGSGRRGDGTVLVGRTHQESSETDGTAQVKPSSAEADLDYSPDPLHKLLLNTYDKLNITTFSVQLPPKSIHPVDLERVTKQIMKRLKPVSSSSSTSSAQTSSSPTLSSRVPFISTAMPSVSGTSFVAPLTSSIAAPSTSSPTSQPSLSPSLPPSSHSSSTESAAVGGNRQNVNLLNRADAASPVDVKLPPVKNGAIPPFRRIPAKSGYPRYPNAKFGLFWNKTDLNLRTPLQLPPRRNLTHRRETETRRASTSAQSGLVRHPRLNFGLLRNKTHFRMRTPLHSSPPLNFIHGYETKTRHTSTRESLSSPSSSVSEEPSSVDTGLPIRNMSGYKDETKISASPEIEQNEKKMPLKRGQFPVYYDPLKRGFLRRPLPNSGPFLNRTHPYLRRLPPPPKPLNYTSAKGKERITSTELPTSSSHPVYKGSKPTEGAGEVIEKTEDIVTGRLSTEFSQTLKETKGPSSHRPNTKVGYFRRPQLYGLRFPNKTHVNPRLPPHRGHMLKPFPIRRLDIDPGSIVGSQNTYAGKDTATEIPGKQSGEQHTPTPTQRVQIQQHPNLTQQINELEVKDRVQTDKSKEEEVKHRDSNSDLNVHEEINNPENIGAPSRGRPTIQQTPSDPRLRFPKPATLPKRHPSSRSTPIRQYVRASGLRGDTKSNDTARRLFDSKTQQTRRTSSKPLTRSVIPSSGVRREPLVQAVATNPTSDGFIGTRDSPEEMNKNFVTNQDPRKDEWSKQRAGNKGREEEREDSEKGHPNGERQPTKATKSVNRKPGDGNKVHESLFTQVPSIESSATTRRSTGSDKTFQEGRPGSGNLPPQTEYTVTLLGRGPGPLSRLHKFVISTGPEPPTNIVFSQVTDNAVTVSWTKPKSPVSSFKVTYTHTDEGEPVSVSAKSSDSSLALSHLTPGSTYEISVISVLGLDESDPITDFVKTLPDRPTDLRVLNVTDSAALLLWRPALAAVDEYAIVYGSGSGSEVRVTVSGNSAEQQLSDLEESTTYTVTVSSQLGGQESPPTSTSFTTAGGSGGGDGGGDGPRDLRATDVGPRSARLSWKPPSNPAGGYRLSYGIEGQEVEEVVLDSSVTDYNLPRLRPGSKYAVQLQAEGGDQSWAPTSTEFTTGSLRFPFPTDCSQELLNGVRTSGEAELFPLGGPGAPVRVYCDMETDGGGWTVFQRRKDGSVNFFRGWKDYVKGFGDLSGEFWLGLDVLHNLTTATKMSLRVDLRDADESAFAKYARFEVGRRNYRLTVGGYSGTAGDSLSYHSNRVFSTKDRDPTPFITRCAMSYRGGWWYKNCHEANLNGLYGIAVKHQGVIWTTWKGKEFSIPFTEMKMRPAAFRPPSRGRERRQ
ncbi:tenascin-like isoform X1 [Antennarius striatus]|uniref:tenascin-like isoform X1 n=1 Tax=Antennarius striatus TaxID=241820 RepID=UPI0035B35E10